MNSKRFSIGIALAALAGIVLACSGQPAATPTVNPRTEADPTPVPPTPEPEAEGQFIDVSGRLDFKRSGIFRGGDGFVGAAWFDYNNDGFLDLFIPNTAQQDNGLFRNNGDGSFENVAAEAGVTSGEGHSSVVAGDLDNDGCADLFMVGDGGWRGSGQTPNKLYANNCDGTFTDVTKESGIFRKEPSWGVALGDVDNDGFLDLFIATGASLDYSSVATNRLYLNNGDLTFTEISASSGVGTRQGSRGVGFSDYNEDGWTDIFAANCLGNTPFFELFENQGDNTFVDVSVEASINRRTPGLRRVNPNQSTGVAFGDYDADGDLDLFSTAWGPHPMIYENVGAGEYARGETDTGIDDTGFGIGSSFADFDNDGYPDFFYVGSYPVRPFEIIGNPGSLMLNNGDKTFSLSHTYGLELTFPSGVATGDFDNDGFPDVLVATTKFQDHDGSPVLLRNAGNDNNWITVKTVGTTSNRDGVGAVVTVSSGDLRQAKVVRAGRRCSRQTARGSRSGWAAGRRRKLR